MNTPHLSNELTQDQYKRLLGELLATIHGDDGHYQAEHGYIKATVDAIHKVNTCIKEIDNLKFELKTLKSWTDDVVALKLKVELLQEPVPEEKEINLEESIRITQEQPMNMREEFEKWAKEARYDVRRAAKHYTHVSTSAAWVVWHTRQKEIDALKAEIEELKRCNNSNA